MTTRSAFPWNRHLVLSAAAFVVMIALVQRYDLDLLTATHFYDASIGGFPARNAFWARDLGHDFGLDIVVCIGVSAIGCLLLGCAGARGPHAAGKADLRRAAGFVLLTLIIGSGSVAMLKKTTNVDCPWDLTVFGGDRPYVELWSSRPPNLPRGRCFPGGHSSGAFGLLGLYFVAWEGWPSAAPWVLGSVLSLGLFFAYVQWARGAHFPSHDLTSAYLCWNVGILLYAGPFGGRLLRAIPTREATR